VDLTFDFPF